MIVVSASLETVFGGSLSSFHEHLFLSFQFISHRLSAITHGGLPLPIQVTPPLRGRSMLIVGAPLFLKLGLQ
jgi:hypothetical protein